MPQPSLDLSAITLPEDDKDKPAELPNAEEKESVIPPAEEKKTEPPIEDKKEEVKEPEKKEDAKEEPKEEKKEEVKTEDKQPPDDKKEEEKKNIPFHEHPDWIKAQRENEDLRKQLADLKEHQEKTDKALDIKEDPYLNLSPRQAAQKRIRDEVDAKKFTPKDQLELLDKFNEYVDHYSKKQSEANESARQKVVKQIDEQFVEMGITDTAQQEKIITLVNSWREGGMTGISVKTLKIAKEYLEARGELTPKKKEEPKEDPDKEKKEADKKKQADINEKISKKGGGTPKNGPTYEVKNAHRKTIGEVITELGPQLDGKGNEG